MTHELHPVSPSPSGGVLRAWALAKRAEETPTALLVASRIASFCSTLEHRGTAGCLQMKNWL